MHVIKNIFLILLSLLSQPLNRGRLLSALKVFFTWQIGTFFLRQKIIFQWVDDSLFIVSKGDTGMTGNLYAGLAEFEDMGFILHVLRPNMQFIDVGANVGAYTILASKVLKAKSISFEPLPTTVEKLRDQLQINRIEDLVTVYDCGVGACNEILRFTHNQDTTNHVVLSSFLQDSIEVPVVSLDEVVSLSAECVLKIDVEGFEYLVLEGAKNILSSGLLVAIIIELNGSGLKFGYSDHSIHQKILSYGFHFATYDPVRRKLSAANKMMSQGERNRIYVRDFEYLQHLCEKANYHHVHTAGSVVI